MKNYFTFFFVLFYFSLRITATDIVMINGINYALVDSTNTAEVRGNQSGYSGDIIIPNIVIHDNKQYTVKSIGQGAFWNCGMLNSVVIADSITTLHYNSFANSLELTSVVGGQNITLIGEHAFEDCIKLSNLHIGNKIERINTFAFSGCTSLTSFTIPDSTTNIEKYAFNNCSNLSSLYIGKKLRSVGKGAFAGCNELNAVYISDIETWCNISFNDYVANPLYFAHYLYLNGELITELEIPESMSILNGTKFVGCVLDKIVITPQIEKIYNNTFQYADIKAVVWKAKKFEIIYDYRETPFYYCRDHIKSITFEDVNKIPQYLFYGLPYLSKIVIPESVQNIGYYTFGLCIGLEEIYNYAEEPQPISNETFYLLERSKCKLYVPQKSITLYKEANIWKEFDIQPISPTPTSISNAYSEGETKKIYKNDQILILRGDKTYTLTGQQVK